MGNTTVHTIIEAGAWLRQGRLVIYPTETFYALGCRADSSAACAAVVRAKGRPQDKPLPVVVGDWDMVQEFFLLAGEAERLAQRFWPGALTLVLPLRRSFAPQVQNASGQVAVRMTSHPAAAALSREVGVPVVTTSANRSGEAAASRPEGLDRSLMGPEVVFLDVLPWPAGGLASTIVAFPQGRAEILREGAVPRQAVEAVLQSAW